MNRSILALALSLSVVPAALGATETLPEARVPEVAASPAAQAPEAPVASLRLEEVRLDEHAVEDAADAAQLGPRGGFWWMVGVVVVAGVILAIVL